MHELGIAESILETVRTEVARRPGERAARVAVRVGELSGVQPDALSFGFECLVKGSDLEPLELVIEYLPHRRSCRDCGVTYEVKDHDFACSACRGANTEHAGGEELEVAYLEMEEA